MRRLPCSLALILLLGLSLGAGGALQAQAEIPPAEQTASSSDAFASLPLAAQAAIAGTLGRDDASYHARGESAALHLANAPHGLTATFTPAGVEVTRGAAHCTLALTGLGHGERLAPVLPATPQATANRVEYRRGLLTEWYLNGPLGLEQGFTLAAPPEDPAAGPLTLTFALGGELTATLDPDRQGLSLQAAGATLLRYQGLSAVDATGKALPVWLDLQGRDLRLQVDVTSARYPITVDPFFQAAKLTASDGGQATTSAPPWPSAATRW